MGDDKTGGQAFPQGDRYRGEGMTLRDWFAGKALSQAVEDYGTPGIRGRDNHGDRIVPYSAKGVGTREQIIAWQAYVYADAMIAERAKEPAQ